MISNLRKKMKDRRGFNMIELMVVVVIIGILAAIAVPIYSKYAKNSRVTEATGRLGDVLTAAKSYAIENESNNTPTDANWPTTCAATNFVGDCTQSQNFTYALTGAANGALTITATGRASTPMNGVTVTLTITDPTQNGTIAITGL
jgi:prepilin-type N-terminal cleavage/methylation domain-containing protein